MTKMPYASIVVIRGVGLNEGKLLMTARKDAPGCWGLPGGKLEPGETAVGAAIREVFEETGVLLFTEELRPIFQDVSAKTQLQVVTFLAEKWCGTASQREPNLPIKWGTFDDLVVGPQAAYQLKLREIVEAL